MVHWTEGSHLTAWQWVKEIAWLILSVALFILMLWACIKLLPIAIELGKGMMQCPDGPDGCGGMWF